MATTHNNYINFSYIITFFYMEAEIVCTEIDILYCFKFWHLSYKIFKFHLMNYFGSKQDITFKFPTITVTEIYLESRIAYSYSF